MRLAAALALILPVAPATAFTAFVPRRHQTFASSFVPTTAHRAAAATPRFAAAAAAAPSAAAGLTMLVETSGGMEELQELTEAADANPWTRQVRRHPGLWRLAGLASIPVGAALGLGLALPTRQLAAQAVGALVSGVAGAVGKSRLDALAEGSALPALAQALVETGVADPARARAALRAVQQTYGLEEEDFEALCTELYATYLQGMVKYNPVARTADLKELQQVREALGLDNLLVGEAHTLAARQWYRQTTLFTPEEELDDPEHPDRQALDKLLFLTERALRQGGETPEAFHYEMARVAKELGVHPAEAMERVVDVAEPFYQRALKSTRAKLGSQQVSSAMLEKARATLGISAAAAKTMHAACYAQEVRELLGFLDDSDEDDAPAGEPAGGIDLSSMKFSENAKERLAQLKEVLEFSDADAVHEIINECMPLYQATASESITKVLEKTSTASQAWEAMQKRREELMLPMDSVKDLVATITMQMLGRCLDQAKKFAKVNNEAVAFGHLNQALEAKAELLSILALSGWNDVENFDQTFCNPWDKTSANGFLVTEERLKLFRIFLTRTFRKMEGGKITNEAYADICGVRGMLGLTDQQELTEFRQVFGSELRKVIQLATDEIVQDYTPELATNMQSRIQSVVENLRLSEDFVRELGVSYYEQAVRKVSDKSPGGVPTPELFKALESLRDLFHLSMEDVAADHMEYFGSVYKKSVLEAMGSTGVIRPEVQEGLDKLRDRLGVSDADCRKLFLDAIEEKMKPMAQWVGSEMERMMLDQKQLAQRRGRDLGEDLFQTGRGASGVLGLGAEVNIMSDIMNLVDFYTENSVAEEIETTSVNQESGMNETTIEVVYPITALGCGAVDQELAELLYRQFVVGSFQAQGEKAARYESNRSRFAGILGLTKAKIEEINGNIAGTVYDNFVSNAMATKGSLDQQDMMFLANIQAKLAISAEEGETMLKKAQRKVLLEELQMIMDSPSPELLKSFREKCNALGLDMEEDVGITKAQMTRMFEYEVIPGLKSGEINVKENGILTEIQESMGMDDEECESVFLSLLRRLTEETFGLISGELLRGREEIAVGLIKDLIRYVSFMDGDTELESNEALSNQIFNVYDAADHSDEDAAEVEKNKQLLKTALGFP